ncbi:hypothetical protein LTR56_016355 [Elasticomyces elasticus]|nr:hypothetical protein LTR56_016355 [Elasticomyces elasticus]KAK3657669.1 hypothetical protein LTR22_009221 [Elasticomyces elasticus]KAK4922475.1 hypothetical protein LTR49_010175 [Elasticomyces elasticus]KAK5760562.1 hypothetical protein LTS12_009271 [Elasticomyces elasticus]
MAEDHSIDAMRLMARIERWLEMNGHLCFTHKPKRHSLLISPSLTENPQPPSLALFPVVDLDQQLRNHDAELASLNAAIKARKPEAEAAAHILLNEEFARCNSQRQASVFEKLNLYQKMMIVRQEQARDLEAEEEHTLIAISGINESTGLSTSNQKYYLPVRSSWDSMQTYLGYMTQCWRANDHSASLGGGTDKTVRWAYQLDAQDAGVCPLNDEKHYARMRKRMHLEKKTSAIMWPEQLWERSQKIRAQAREIKVTVALKTEDDGWTDCDAFDDMALGSDGLFNLEDETEPTTQKPSGERARANYSGSAIRYATRPQTRSQKM